MIRVPTDSAARVIRKQLEKQARPQGGLRIAVKAGGCSGFSYTFAWDDSARDSDHVYEGPGVPDGAGARLQSIVDSTSGAVAVV